MMLGILVEFWQTWSCNMADNVSSSGGIGFFGLLTILFIGLKLTGYVAWSWVWVLSPIWIPGLFIVGFFLMALIIALLNAR